MSPSNPRRTGPRLKLARRLRGLAERDDLPLPEVDTLTLRDGSEVVRARWRSGDREVLVGLAPDRRTLSCHRGLALVWRRPLARDGVGSLRRALAWMCGEVGHPEGEPS